MWNAISTFLKPYLTWIAAGAIALVVGTIGWLSVDLALTKSALTNVRGDLKVAESTIEGQRRAIEAIDRIERRQEETTRMLRNLSRIVRETEGADQPISQAAATVWRDGLECLRAHSCDTGSPETLPPP